MRIKTKQTSFIRGDRIGQNNMELKTWRNAHVIGQNEQQEPEAIRDELRYSGRINSFCFICGIRRFILVTNQEISHEWGKDEIVI